MKPTNILFFLTPMVLLLLASCDAGSGKGHFDASGDTIEIKYATNLTMIDYGNFMKADFRNPWDTTRTLQTYLLVRRDSEMPKKLPEGIVVKTPLQKSVIYTSTHNSLVEELGAIEAISGICDPQYVRNDSIRLRIEQGKIVDCGSSMAPNIEKILMLNPDAIMLSAFENSNDHNKVGQLGIPIIDCTDYMETSPLARAEWMRFYGRLFGKGDQADSLFCEVEKAYLGTKEKTACVTNRPMVLTELIYGATWDVPAAYSTIGTLIEDAGGKNPFDNYKKSGSVKLAPEEVLYRAQEADVWLIIYSQNQAPTLLQIANDNPIYAKFHAYTAGNIYGCDANQSSYFEDIAFHPDWILAEYASILHPEMGEMNDNHQYYNKLSRQ